MKKLSLTASLLTSSFLFVLSCHKINTISDPSPRSTSAGTQSTARPLSISVPTGTLQVFTLAGDGTTPVFSSPAAVAVDAAGNVYVADAANNRIRLTTPAGVTTTLAGTGVAGYKDGQGSTAQFNNPTGIAVDRSGNVFVADRNNNRIRKITPDGNVSLLAGKAVAGFTDGKDSSAQFSSPAGIAADTLGNLYVTDVVNERIRMISTTRLVTTLAGNGNTGSANGPGGFAASFNHPIGIAIDGSGIIYVADSGNNQIRKITPDRLVSLLTGSPQTTPGNTDGAPAMATFNSPTGVAVDGSGTLYVADKGNHRVRQVNPAGSVSAWAGNGTASFLDGPATGAEFNLPTGIAADGAGNIFVADAGNNRIRAIEFLVMVSTVAGSGGTGLFSGGFADGPALSAQFKGPNSLAVITTPGLYGTGQIWVTDGGNNRIRVIAPPDYFSTSIHVLTESGSTPGYLDITGPNAGWYVSMATFSGPSGIATDAAGAMYIADRSNHAIRKIFNGVSTIAGNGTAGFAEGQGTAAQFNCPTGLAVDTGGNIYVADWVNNRIRKITAAGLVTTLAGNGTRGFVEGQGATAEFNSPSGVAVDLSGNVYVADQGNNRIRKITPAGMVSTLAGNGTPGLMEGTGAAAEFYNPAGIAVDPSGTVYVADQYNNRIRKITQAGIVSTLAGSGTAFGGGYIDGPGKTAQFSWPTGVALDGAGAIYVADNLNNRIRKIQ